MTLAERVTRFLGRVGGGGAVLCYHSVTTSSLPGRSEVHVPLEELVATLELLQRAWDIVSLQELLRRQRDHAATGGLVAVSFDDAYAALLAGAADVMRRQQIPITVFVVTNAAQEGLQFWWDRVEDAFARVSPAGWGAFERAVGLPTAYRTGQPPEFGPLRPLRQWILAEYSGRWPAVLEGALRDLEADAGVRSVQRSMTYEELDRLVHACPLVEIGTHTASHPVLPHLNDEDVNCEVAGSFETLRARYATAVPLLALPFGLFDRRTLGLAREAGMEASLILGNTTIGHRAPETGVPRFVMTAGERGWRVTVKALGLRERFRGWRAPVPTYPALPSATT